jgi:hypothetical protein
MRFPPSTEVERVVSHLRPANESAPLLSGAVCHPQDNTAVVISILCAVVLQPSQNTIVGSDILTAPGPSEHAKVVGHIRCQLDKLYKRVVQALDDLVHALGLKAA